jgi:Phage integrase, N-terminal SAM-like domain
MARAKRRGNHEGSITKRADGRWMASVTIGRDSATGKLKRAYFYGKTRQEVADLLARALSDVSRGAFVAPNKLTVGEWLNTWLFEYKRPNVRPLTFANYERVIRCHLVPALGHLPLQDLRPDHVQGLYNEKLRKGLMPGTIWGIHVVLHGALKQAVKHQSVLQNVTEATAPPMLKRHPIQPLSLLELGTFLKATAQDRLFPAILLSFGTGLRRGGSWLCAGGTSTSKRGLYMFAKGWHAYGSLEPARTAKRRDSYSSHPKQSNLDARFPFHLTSSRP